MYNSKYDAGKRITDLVDAIRNIQKDGLKVGIKDNKLYVENTVYTAQHGKQSPFGYKWTDIFAD